jgi:hypothetical protein
MKTDNKSISVFENINKTSGMLEINSNWCSAFRSQPKWSYIFAEGKTDSKFQYENLKMHVCLIILFTVNKQTNNSKKFYALPSYSRFHFYYEKNWCVLWLDKSRKEYLMYINLAWTKQ